MDQVMAAVHSEAADVAMVVALGLCKVIMPLIQDMHKAQWMYRVTKPKIRVLKMQKDKLRDPTSRFPSTKCQMEAWEAWDIGMDDPKDQVWRVHQPRRVPCGRGYPTRACCGSLAVLRKFS
jgi:hypothetical protein